MTYDVDPKDEDYLKIKDKIKNDDNLKEGNLNKKKNLKMKTTYGRCRKNSFKGKLHQ